MPHKSVTNAFDAFSNRKCKFHVLNRTLKGQNRNLKRARENAIDRRKKSLLVEYAASLKDNSVRDRRFGEDDPSLSLEDKMLMRFQRERQKRARKSVASRFSLNDDENLLTPAIGHGDNASQEEDETTSEVQNMHFSGRQAGHSRKRPLSKANDIDAAKHKRSRTDIMQEVITQSKLHKAQKARQKDQQDMLLGELEVSFHDLLPELQFRHKPEGNDGRLTSIPQPSALEHAASQRRKHKRATEKRPLLDDAVEDYELLLAGLGHAASRTVPIDRQDTESQSRQPGEIVTNKGLGHSLLDRQPSIANELSSSKSISGATSRLKGPGGSDSHEVGRACVDLEAERLKVPLCAHDQSVTNREHAEIHIDVDVQEAQSQSRRAQQTSMSDTSSSEVEEFVQQQDEAGSLAAVVDRAYSHSNIASGVNLAQKCQPYEMLLQRYIHLGDMQALPDSHARAEMNALAQSLRELVQEDPDAGREAWFRTLGACHRNLDAQDLSLASPSGRQWPSSGILLALRLNAEIYPAAAPAHGVVASALWLLGRLLTSCCVQSAADLKRGLFCMTLALQHTVQSRRLMPEAHAFLISTLGACAGRQTELLPLATFSQAIAQSLAQGWSHWISGQGDEEMRQIDMMTTDAEECTTERDRELAASLSGQAVKLITLLIDRILRLARERCMAAMEVLGPIQAVLTSLTEAAGSAADLQRLAFVRKLKTDIECAIAETEGEHLPSLRKEAPRTGIRSLDPAIIDNSVLRKDKGVDRETGKVKQLARQVKREKKGAMRELRRDASFLDWAKVREQQKSELARKATLSRNTTWLQREQATFNQQVRKDRGKALRGGGNAHR